jgi:hypothetical protein
MQLKRLVSLTVPAVQAQFVTTTAPQAVQPATYALLQPTKVLTGSIILSVTTAAIPVRTFSMGLMVPIFRKEFL